VSSALLSTGGQEKESNEGGSLQTNFAQPTVKGKDREVDQPRGGETEALISNGNKEREERGGAHRMAVKKATKA